MNRVQCIQCSKSYVTRQGMEQHILHSKSKCYPGDKPAKFEEYCATNNRVYCLHCDKLFSVSKPCCHIVELVDDMNFQLTDGTGHFSSIQEEEPGMYQPHEANIDNTTTNSLRENSMDNWSGSIGENFQGGREDNYNSQPTETSLILETFDSIEAIDWCLKNPIEVVQTIPTAARRDVADAFSRILNLVARQPTNDDAHARLFLFASYVCARKKDKKLKQSTMTKKRAASIMTASFDEIIRTLVLENIKKTNQVKPRSPALKSVKRLISLGRYGDAVRMLTSDGVHPSTPEVINSLREKHPEAAPISERNGVPQNLQFSNDEVLEVINSFPNGSSGGPCALTEQHLKDMANVAQLSHTFLSNLAAFASMFVSGKFPKSVSQFYGSARLIPLIKNDGGVRPMAVGETLRRLSCKLALKIVKNDIPALLLPHQLGVGTPLGTEAIIHTMAAAVENLAEDEAILQIDFKNAFNLVAREKIIELVHIHLPELYNVVLFLYSNQGFLKIGNGNDTILSCSGVQQGCPLAPLLFALVLQELVNKIHSSVPGLKINLWYLDDGHLSGKVQDLLASLKIIEDFGRSIGLMLNMSKCVVLGKFLDEFPPEILKAEEGLMVLGSPIGKSEFVARKVKEKISNAALTLFKSRAIEDPQQELLLLRCCSGAPKMVYWLRTCRPDVIASELLIMDRVIDDSLQHILGSPIFNDKRKIMHLPLSFGGLGIPIASKSKEAAFVASIGSSWHLHPGIIERTGYQEAVSFLKSKGAIVPELPPNNGLTNSQPIGAININSTGSPQIHTAKEFSQTKFMNAVNTEILESIRANADIKMKIILDGRACKGSSFWLTTAPNRWNNTTIEPASFRSLIKYYLGIPLMSQDQACPDCKKPQDRFGHHALSCKVASGKIDQHNSIVDGISLHLKSAAINHHTEEKNPMKENNQRPGDIYLPTFDTYGDAFFDLSVITTCANAYYKRAAKGQLEGSKIRYCEKMKKYPELGFRFKPLILESTGGWNAYSFDYLKKMAEMIASRSNKLSKVVLNSLLTMASFRLQRNQGTLLVRRCLGR